MDVYNEEPLKESPLLKLDNVMLTPHVGAQTAEAKKRIGTKIVEKVKLFKDMNERNKTLKRATHL